MKVWLAQAGCWLVALVIPALIVPGAAPAVAAPRMVVVRVALVEDTATLALGSTSGLDIQDARGRVIWKTSERTRLTVRRGGFFIQVADPEAVSHVGPFATAAEAQAPQRELSRLLGHDVPLVRFDLVVAVDDYLLLQGPAAPLRIVAPTGYVTYRGGGYRGAFTVDARPTGLLLVNEVDLEDYLSSVVGAEMPPSWPREALRAQAIAARTYLLAHRSANESVPYDICATQRCQVYQGLSSEAVSTRSAVRDTAGQVLTYDGRLITALYSSNSGGTTESSEYAFGSALPYLRSVASPGDAAASSYRWAYEIGDGDLQAALGAADIGSLRGLSVTARSPSGRALTVRIDGSADSVQVPATRLRTTLGLRSTLFWPAFAPATNVALAADDRAARDAVRLAGGRRAGILDTEEPRSAADARRLGTVWLYSIPARVEIEGRGFGHGVGMSQWGARGMALAGVGYRSILAHYYPGTSLRSDYGRE